MSWDQLLSIKREQSKEAQIERLRVPVSCPNDGEPLIDGPDGKPFCKFDGWKPT